ncbi:MAG TPA: cache domain-containing protein [Candidatus Sulfotelmatobacter sp.]|jgi:methyl-accepting chemotaxis protein|nr:cache domain-containing protein [Candidatus Sulfotelmatobacter sp.]
MRTIKLSVKAKIWGLIGLMLIGLGILSAEDLSSMHDTLIEDRRQALQHEVETTESLVAMIQERAQKGEISEADAKASAIALLRQLRYGGSEAFIVTDTHYITIVHPFRPDLVGKDMSNEQDAEGKLFARDQVDLARRDGSGYLTYSVAKAKGAAAQTKLAYASLFRPWGWVIMTAAYIDDLDATFRTRAMQVIAKALIISILGAIGLVLLARSITKPMAKLVTRMDALATATPNRRSKAPNAVMKSACWPGP